MTQVLSFVPRPMEAAQVHQHMDLNKAAHESAQQGVYGPRRSPSPTSSGLIRKRAASLSGSDPNNHGLLDHHLSINTNVAMKPDAARDTICLCTPTPKIPRPRNAFILYRQHHQSQVTADNPKLSNPEISKIIGEKWKHEVDDVKETWKRLAEEEKQRHQQQYPNYRYQPRRGSKAQGNWPGTPTSDDHGRCTKCHGRSIATPRTPSTPIATPPSAKPGTSSQGAPSLSRLDTSIPRRMSMELSPISTLPLPHQLPPVRGLDDGEISPGMKRRRANGAGNYHAVGRPLSAYGEAPGDSLHNSPDGQHPSRRVYPPTTLPEISTIPRSHSGPMPPPPRPPGSAGWADVDHSMRRHSGFDESLRLPPLQTSLSPTHSRNSALDVRPPMLPSPNFDLPSPDDSRFGSLEESVMSIPLKRKLGLLARISRPVRASRPGHTADSSRGAFIAVEGPNADMLQDVSRAVEKAASAAGGDVSMKTFTGEAESTDSAIGNEKGEKKHGEEDLDGDSYQSYFRLVMSWQEKAKQIAQHVSGEQVSTAPQSPSSTNTDAPKNKLPIALVKDGYSLTMADKAACGTPISDWFTPQDHWQWMASIWRGMPSPDLIVYAVTASEDEIKQLGAVELAKQMGLMTIRLPAGRGLDESTERRMAFELSEWMREGSFREEMSRSWRID